MSGICFMAYNCDVACKWLYPFLSSRFGPTMGQRSDLRCSARINTDLISIENETADLTTEPDAQRKAVVLGLGKVGECPRMIMCIGWQTNSPSIDIDTDTYSDIDMDMDIDICRDIDIHSFIKPVSNDLNYLAIKDYLYNQTKYRNRQTRKSTNHSPHLLLRSIWSQLFSLCCHQRSYVESLWKKGTGEVLCLQDVCTTIDVHF